MFEKIVTDTHNEDTGLAARTFEYRLFGWVYLTKMITSKYSLSSSMFGQFTIETKLMGVTICRFSGDISRLCPYRVKGL